MANKRITELQTKSPTNIDINDYIISDSATDGTKKIPLQALQFNTMPKFVEGGVGIIEAGADGIFSVNLKKEYTYDYDNDNDEYPESVIMPYSEEYGFEFELGSYPGRFPTWNPETEELKIEILIGNAFWYGWYSNMNYTHGHAEIIDPVIDVNIYNQGDNIRGYVKLRLRTNPSAEWGGEDETAYYLSWIKFNAICRMQVVSL